MMKRWSLGVLAAVVALSAGALAQKPDKGDKHEDKAEKHEEKKEEKGDKKDEKAAAKGGDDDDDEGAPPPAGSAAASAKPVAGRRTPAQLAFRKGTWERREKDVEARVHKGGKRITDEEREAIKAHWLKIARLMRIRELAEADKADAIVKRVDAAIEKEEKKVGEQLDKLNAKAPGGAK